MNPIALLRASLLAPPATRRDRWGWNILYEGGPGLGKSQMIVDLCESLGVHCEVVIASTREPSDIIGIPYPDGERMRLLTPDWAVRAAEAKRAIIFFDEFRLAPPAVQNACLRVVNEGYVGNFKLPPTVSFIGAQNTQEQSLGGWDIGLPMMNRWDRCRWGDPNAEQWVEYLMNSKDEVTQEDFESAANRMREPFEAAYARTKQLIAGYITHRRDALYALPKGGEDKDGNDSLGFATPRSWMLFCKVRAACMAAGVDKLTMDAALRGCVGDLTGLYEYEKNANLPDPKDVLTKKTKFKHDKHRNDITVAVLGSCATLIAGEQDKVLKKRYGARLWEILEEVREAGAGDLGVGPARKLLKERLLLPEASPFLERMEKILNESGTTKST